MKLLLKWDLDDVLLVYLIVSNLVLSWMVIFDQARWWAIVTMVGAMLVKVPLHVVGFLRKWKIKKEIEARRQRRHPDA